MCDSCLGPATRKQFAEKRRWPAEVQAALDRFEREFGTLARQMQERLADAVINRDITPEGDINAAVRRVLSEDQEEFRLVLQEGARNGLDAGRRMASRRFDLDIDFEVLPQAALDELEDFVNDVEPEVLDTVGDGVERTIEEAFNEGLDRDDVADVLRGELDREDVSEFLQNGLDNELGENAAQRHARTIVQGASERGNDTAIQESSAIGERWVVTSDDRARDSHMAADGQIIPAGGTFLVGGDRLRHPGDPQGSIEEIAMCRCTIQPVFESELNSEQIITLRGGGRLNV